MRRRIAMVVLGLLQIILLHGQIITDRPDQTESSSSVGKGNLQIESGVLIGYEGNGQNSIQQILAPTTLFRYGVTNGIELRFLSQYETLNADSFSINGISDIEIGTKIDLIKSGDKNIEMAFLSHLVVPTGSHGLSGEDYGVINKISISHELKSSMSIGYNLGYNYFGEDSGDFTYSLALGIGVNDKVGIYIEPYGEVVNFEDYISNCDAGVTYLVNDNLQMDVSFGTGINKRMNYISLGISWLVTKEE